jgi:hypothetical protein
MIKSSPMRRIGSAHVLGAVALFVSLGGTAMANDSVRAFITGAQVRDGSLTGRDVRNRSIASADLAPGVLRAGPQGPAGPQGDRGPAGPDLAGATHVRVGGDRSPAENGAALRTALASISDASVDKPYAIQLAPGVYDLGGTTLAMKPDVSIVGAGRDATRIIGDQGQAEEHQALVLGANRTVLRDVTVANHSDAPTVFHNVMAVQGGARMRIEDAVLEVYTATRGYVLVATGGSSVDVSDSRLTSESGEVGSTALATGWSQFRIRGSELVATGRNFAFAVTAKGSTAVVESSAILSTGVAVNGPSGGSVAVGASRVVGRGVGNVSCVASYNGNFALVGADCN